jgi:catechol 2,3-dioxygenase-like lactoylglutathione lyase family enzyme
VRRLEHLSIVVRDLERTRRFYVDILGMRCVPRPAFNFEGLWFQAENTLVHAILEHVQSGPAPDPAPAGLTLSRTQHMAFEVESAEQAAVWLRAQGVEIVSGPKLRPDGPVQVFVTDPDHHVVELFNF